MAVPSQTVAVDPVLTLSQSLRFNDPAPSQVHPDEPPAPAPAEVPAEETVRVPPLKAFTIYKTISERTRFRIVDLLSAGDRYTAARLAKLLHHDERVVARHLKRLRACGLIFAQKGEDRRCRENGIRPIYLRGVEDGYRIVDFGTGVLRFPVNPKA
jgi:DNA-binding transcriptional ArsR family regulator